MDFRCRTEPPSQHVCMDFPCWANRPCGGMSTLIFSAGLNRLCGGMSAWIFGAGRTARAAARLSGFPVQGEPPVRRHVNIDFQCWIEPPVRRHVRVDFRCRTAAATFFICRFRRFARFSAVVSLTLHFWATGSGKDWSFPARDLDLCPELASQRPVFRLFPNAARDCPPQSQSQQRICGLTSLLAGVIMSAGGSCRLRDSAAEWSGFHRRVLGAKP